MKCEHSLGYKFRDLFVEICAGTIISLILAWPLQLAWNYVMVRNGWFLPIEYWDAFAMKWVAHALVASPIRPLYRFKENS